MSKRILRSLLVQAPFLQEAAIRVKRGALNLVRKPFEPEFEILRHLTVADGECFVDIGANRGQSIDAMRLYSAGTPIIGFEPQSRLAAALCERYESNSNLDIRNRALGRSDASITLFTPHYGNWVFDGLASLDRAEAAGWLNAKTLIGFEASKLRLEEETVEVRTLDAESLAPAFIKIDVQGAEADVLAGASETLGRRRPVLLIETGTNEALVEQVVAGGYKAYNFSGGRLVERCHAVRNCVFVHPDAVRGLDRIGASKSCHK